MIKFRHRHATNTPCRALLQKHAGDKHIAPFADEAVHEPIQRPAFSALHYPPGGLPGWLKQPAGKGIPLEAVRELNGVSTTIVTAVLYVAGLTMIGVLRGPSASTSRKSSGLLVQTGLKASSC